MKTKYPQGHKTEDNKPFWSNIRRFPDTVDVNSIIHDELNMRFVKSTSILLCYLFKFDIPNSETITDIIKSKISSQVASADQIVVEISSQEFQSNIELLKGKLTKFKNPPTISLRNISIEDSNQQEEIMEFLYSATNLRVMNFKLNMIRKYKVEEKIFQITPNLDMISSLPATMTTIDLIKFCMVKIQKSL